MATLRRRKTTRNKNIITVPSSFQMVGGDCEYFRPITIYIPIWYYMTMQRTALFLKQEQIKKLLALSEKTGAPVAELIRRAIDKYLLERAKELKSSKRRGVGAPRRP